MAAWYLTRRGCGILRRNVRVGPDEIDLVIRDGETVAAVEVKYTNRPVDPLEAVDDEKLERIRRAITKLDPPVRRVDLLGVAEIGELLEIRWLRTVG